jgi:hypothetical protein
VARTQIIDPKANITLPILTAHDEALAEAIQRARKTRRHDDGLILALAAHGVSPYAIADMLGITDGYVRNEIRRAA